MPRPLDRRSFLHAAGFSALAAGGALARPLARRGGYGPLVSALDETTGLPLVRLPQGFTYRTFGWTGDPMFDGTPTPARPDGMGVVAATGAPGVLAIVRNHEVGGPGTPFGDPAITYDVLGAGGTTTLLFNARTGRWVGARASLAGTNRNCAGGPTPWGSWLSAEESVDGPPQGFDRKHGWIFEVPATLPAHPVALREMGRFVHEAVAVDPKTGYVYETEDDRYTSGFYRFRPKTPLQVYGLEDGGVLEMLKVVGIEQADLQVVSAGQRFGVEWVPVPDPVLKPQTGNGPWGSFDGATNNSSGPFLQGWEAGGARFRRLEGCWYGDGRIYFVDTEGGHPAPDSGAPEGTVWAYDPAREELEVLFESPSEAVLDNPDNIAVSPRGGIVLCEDGQLSGQRLHGLTPTGALFPLAENTVVLNGEVNGITGSFTGSEWAGATFDPAGRWLFVNIQSPGITLAITGPWERGGL